MKRLKSYILLVSSDDLTRGATHTTYRAVLSEFARRGCPVTRSYFARYGNPEAGGTINVHVTAPASLRVAREVARKFADARVERRGDLSPLHALLMDAALHPDSADVKQVTDAFHWFCNASGFSYMDEAMLANQISYAAVASLAQRGPQVQ